jgi:UrcA family protein
MTFAPLKSTLVACISLAALAGAAHADNPPRAVVEFQSEQLLTAQGRNALRARIASSAEDVCIVPRGQEFELRRERRDCIENAIEQAERQLEQKIAAVADRRFARTETRADAQG